MPRTVIYIDFNVVGPIPSKRRRGSHRLGRLNLPPVRPARRQGGRRLHQGEHNLRCECG